MRGRIFKGPALVALGLFVAAALSLYSGCRNQVEGPEGGTSARIVPGKRIDGVALGDSKERVDGLLSKPDAQVWIDGMDRAWLGHDYREGRHVDLRVAFLDRGGIHGPVDALSVHAPYDGKTKEGIGIVNPRWEKYVPR